ncbi:hypothetical protein L6164_030299 [Bauhinia variegata]|uniref:Uncharacterized protein n=1 Tax=Bauhinia variegata TaxID=167791 RepID=A0ACB9LBG2_BAUVA|nr:hypothetical protein L6164_030299 [Bauhinia variegata]
MRFNKRIKEIRNRFDTIMDKAIEKHQEEKKEIGGGGQIKDLLDIFLGIYEDENSKLKLTKENIKVLMMVSDPLSS